MGAIKNWLMGMVYELSKEGLSNKEIAQTLECDIEFVEAILGD